jgi:hypothetical protein
MRLPGVEALASTFSQQGLNIGVAFRHFRYSPAAILATLRRPHKHGTQVLM